LVAVTKPGQPAEAEKSINLLRPLWEISMNARALVRDARFALCLAALGTAAALAGAARADEESSERDRDGFVCSNETLRGNYGFTITGLRPTMKGGPQVAIAGTALTTFHGDGTFTQFDNINVNSPSIPFQPDRPGSGTYSLKGDCSGTMWLTASGVTLELAITVVDHGREVRTAVVSPAVIVTSNGRKI
jgi:hypothetical protein